jgi:hypothetical protein
MSVQHQRYTPQQPAEAGQPPQQPSAAWRNSRATLRRLAKPRYGRVAALAVSGFIVWGAGVAFTQQVVAGVWSGATQPLLIAIAMQSVLSAGQWVMRSRRAIGVGVLLFLVDVLINYAGLALAVGVIATADVALTHLYAAVTTNDATVNTLACCAVAALIAVAPETFWRLALKEVE